MTEPSSTPPGDPASAPTDDPRNLGEQPIVAVMDRLGLTPQDLVRASTEQVTFKMVQRARKGRRLNSHVMVKVRNALNAAAGVAGEGEGAPSGDGAGNGEGERRYALSELFNYARERRQAAESVEDDAGE